MQTVKLRKVLDAIAGLQGAEPVAVGHPDFLSYIASLNRHLERGWQHDFWPEWTITEQRPWRMYWYDRPGYGDEGFAYYGGEEVYDALAMHYYRANTDIAPGSPRPGLSLDWDLATNIVKYLALAKPEHPPYLSAIGEVQRICRNDPVANPKRPGEVPHTMTNRGIVPLGNTGDLVYVTFRKPAPEFTAAPWDNTEAYAADDLVYDDDEGDCFKAVQAGTNHAVTDTAYWARVEFPQRLKNFVTLAVYNDQLRGDGQTSRALAETGPAEAALILAHDAVFMGQG